MHGRDFDRLTRSWLAVGTRRGLLRVLAGTSLVGLLAAWHEEETDAGRRSRRARHRARGHNHKDKKRANKQEKRKGRGKGKDNKDKKKDAPPCANVGQMLKKGKRCCEGLVKDGTGSCASPPSGPTSPGCATTCPGCCAGETCITSRTNATCGTGGAPCAPCTFPQTCGGGTVPGVCGCTPNTTCPGPLNCGEIDNGCGTATIDCGDCTSPDTCGGGTPSTPNVCGCTPTCPSNACGDEPDGCGHTISCNTCENPTPICAGGSPCAPCVNSEQCGANHLCREGSCFACDAVCSNPVGCENLVRDAIEANAGTTIYICPGKYKEALSISQDLTLIGAGSGDGIEDTILQGQANKRVLTINSGVNVELNSLRITGGSVSGGVAVGDGGGIYNFESDLTMTDCAVFENSANRGGGIFNSDGTLSLTDCAVLENEAAGEGGGIYTELGSVTLDDSHVTDNTAVGNGGGIYSDVSNVTLNGTSSVTGNSPPQCVGATC